MTRSEMNIGSSATPAEMRAAIRQGLWPGPTAGCCPGFTQVNLVVLPAEYSFHFMLFCQRNPKPCPVLEVVEEGGWEPRRLAPGADIRTDCPRYRVFRNGAWEERTEVLDLWRDDLVTFLLGCSFTFERAMIKAGLPVRHVEEGRNVPMFVTDIQCDPAGPFKGPLVVSMRPVPAAQISRAVQVTARYPGVHGAPVHVGRPEEIGIKDLSRPDFGDPVTVKPGETAVFWACGVTPQMAMAAARPELAVTHAPGHMFITSRRDEDWAVY